MVLPRYSRSLLAISLLGSMLVLAGCNQPDGAKIKVSDNGADSSSQSSGNGATPAAGTIEAAVGQMFNGAKPTSIADTPIEGLKEVVVNGQIYYATPNGSHMVSGEIMQVDGRKNITSETRDRLRADMMGKLNTSDAIVYKAKGTKKEVLNVFTDVECGYCRQFHQNIDAYTKQGYEIHYYPWPRSGTSGPVYDEMVSVWCAKDQHAALTSAKSGTKPPAKTCDNPVSKYFELGREMGIQGTPAVFLKNGKQIGGYVPPENIAAAIDQANGKPPASP